MTRDSFIAVCGLFQALSLLIPMSCHAEGQIGIFDRDNLVAWCVVPFDSRRRGPEERAEMLRRAGIEQLAYDWRAEHIPTFDEEMETLERWGIDLKAFWFPGGLNEEARAILDVLERHNLRTELWVSLHGGEIECSSGEQARRVKEHAEILRPIAEEAARIGCKVGLYNHGGWFGEPENQIEIITYLGLDNLGLVYNLHHGHSHLERFPELLEKMKPYLLCLNLNGMTEGGEEKGQKILPLGSGDLDLNLLKVIRDGGYTGPIGVLGHTMDDAEDTLLDNLDGLDWLVEQLDGSPPDGPRPPLRTGPDAVDRSGIEIEDPARRAELPEYQILPAAAPDELTPALESYDPEEYVSWTRSHGDSSNTRFSSLSQIDRENVKNLEEVWVYRSGDGEGNIQCNPIMVDGVMYAPTVGENLVAIDAKTGQEVWRFDPEGRPAFRGLVYWEGFGTYTPRLFVSSGQDLWALDPSTGTPLPEFGEEGKIEAGEIRVVGAIFKNVLVVPGYVGGVFGYDVFTGKKIWEFNTIPKEGEYGRDTWDGPEKGANCWGGMALDETRGVAYVTTGSPKPDYNGTGRHGQNLFGNCVLALDALTGERLWHFQEIRHDIWDLDIPAPPNLVTVNHEGKRVDAVAQVTKIGNTLLLDRVTGKPLFPFRLRRAPVSKLPGERTWPYQPDVESPEPFVRQGFTLEDVTDRSEEARKHVLATLEKANLGWFEPFEEDKPTALFGVHGGAEWTGAAFDPTTGHLFVSATELPWIITVFRPDQILRDPNAAPTRGETVFTTHCVQCHGADRRGVGMAPPLHGLGRRMTVDQVLELLQEGRNAMPAAATLTVEEKRDLLDYLFLRDVETAPPSESLSRPVDYTHNGYPKLLDHEGYPGCKPPWGTLNCIDLNTGKIAWKVPLGEYPDLAFEGVTDTGAENFGGAMVTAGGLVFCAGTPDEKIRAFDKESGEVLWEHELPWGGYAPPATYEANGRQYVVIAATGGGKLGGPMGDAYVAFALPE